MVPRPQLILLVGWLPVKGVGWDALRALAFCQGVRGVFLFLFLFSFLYFQPLLRWFFNTISLFIKKKKKATLSSKEKVFFCFLPFHLYWALIVCFLCTCYAFSYALLIHAFLFPIKKNIAILSAALPIIPPFQVQVIMKSLNSLGSSELILTLFSGSI